MGVKILSILSIDVRNSTVRPERVEEPAPVQTGDESAGGTENKCTGPSPTRHSCEGRNPEGMGIGVRAEDKNPFPLDGGRLEPVLNSIQEWGEPDCALYAFCGYPPILSILYIPSVPAP